jgi:hypothetical protein
LVQDKVHDVVWEMGAGQIRDKKMEDKKMGRLAAGELRGR